MFLTKFLSDENVVDIEGMDGEGIFFYCQRPIEDKQSAMRIVTMMMMMMMLHEVLKGNQNVGAQTQDHQSAQLSS